MKTLKDVNWNQVYCFYEVARKLSMKDAAELLCVSTPTVSEQIKKLEELVGLKLFIRHPRQIALTDEGASLFACAREMFEAGGRFLDTVSPNSIGGYTVRVAIQETLLAPVGIDFVNQYWDLFAPFGIVNTVRELRFEQLEESLLQGRYDWAVSFETPRSPRMVYREVLTSELVFCCSAGLLEKFRHKEDILRNIPFARSTWDSSLNEVVNDSFREARIFPGEIIESDHQQFIISLAQRGRCVAVLPRQVLAANGGCENLKTFTLGKPITMRLFAIWPKGSERMISIKKLVELLDMSEEPASMTDPDLQIKVGDVKDGLLL